MIVAIDLETTWLNKNKDKIIEISLIKFDEESFDIIWEYNSLINPEIDIPELNSNLTWIKDEDVKDAPRFKEVAEDIKDFIWDLAILGHNTYFDRDFLIEFWIDIEKNIVLDTFFLANCILKNPNSLSLESLSLHYKLNLEWAHRARNDVIATIKLFEKLKNEFESLDKEKKTFINYIFSKWEDSSFDFLLNYFSLEKDEKQYKLLKDTDPKSILKIIKKYKKNDKIEEKSDLKVSFDKKYLSKLDNFEIRENQSKMADLVIDSLENNKKNVIEAPTWVWKTFAYLVPSILYSIKTWEKIFISTSTKALQDQIINKDLVFLEKNLDIDFNFTKLKWKKNYLWVSFYIDLIFSDKYFKIEESSLIIKIFLWLYNTKYWELDELNFYPKEYNVLREIDSDKAFVLINDNIYKDYEFLYKARQKALNSNIVIINNSILVQDIMSDNSILWNPKNLIIDEAHKLEDNLSSSLKKDFNLKMIEDYLDHSEKILRRSKLAIKDFFEIKDEIKFKLWLFFDGLDDYYREKQSFNNNSWLLVKNDFFSNLDNLSTKSLINAFDKLIYILNSFWDISLFLTKDLNFYENFYLFLKRFISKDFDKYIFIINYNEKYWFTYSYTYLNIWEYIDNKLWKKLDSLVLTSATLRIWEDFSYIKNILNLKDDFYFDFLESDFDYSKQALIYIPNDLWSIKVNKDFINEFLLRFFLQVKWNTLVLATSFQTIRNIYLWTNFELKSEKINLLSQNINWWKSKLIEMYKNNSENSILLWTDTFWEWIDIPWDDLKYLVIHKIPFMVPNDPIYVARSSLFSNPFRDYSIPKAIIKLKQWFWRLIRTKNDKWIAIFLDDRIYSSSWWKEILESFPNNLNIKYWDSDKFFSILKAKK